MYIYIYYIYLYTFIIPQSKIILSIQFCPVMSRGYGRKELYLILVYFIKPQKFGIKVHYTKFLWREPVSI